MKRQETGRQKRSAKRERERERERESEGATVGKYNSFSRATQHILSVHSQH